MVTVPVPEIKRRGIGSFDESIAEGPLCLIRNNRPAYVLLSFDAFRELEDAATLARVAASEEDVRAGRTATGSADDLMAALDGD